MLTVDKHRANVKRLINYAVVDARLRNKKIDRIDPLMKCARHIFPYLHDEVIYDISRTALRILMSEKKLHANLGENQTRLTEHTPV